MRAAGATRIVMDGVEIEFPGAQAPESGQSVDLTVEEEQKRAQDEAERLLYGSS